MRRLVAIFLLLTLPFQALWGAAEPYCQHEHGRAAQHLGHHVHDHEASRGDAGAQQPDHSAQAKAKAKAVAMADHGHHCCSAWSLVPDAVILPELLGTTAVSGSTLSSLSSAEPGRIERPNWSVSL